MLPEVEDLLSEYAMIASVAECSNASSIPAPNNKHATAAGDTNDDDNEFDDAEVEYGIIKNLYDIRGYCHFDLPFAQFKINHFEDTGVFVIELLSGPHIVFHMSFRFSHDQHQIVLNASSHGNWGEEVRYHNPLHNGDHFHLHVHVHSGYYEVEINGNQIGTFYHRFPVESIQALGIHGGVHIDSIEFGGFAFERDWGHHQNPDSHFGHAGFIGYGTSAYQPPQFNDPQHPHQRYF